ncbi:trafficking protein particle complex subunit 6b-like [Apostichopus japonicus]
MADEFVFEFLHMEIVSYFEKQTEEDDNLIISKLEQMGCRVGQSLSERFTRDSPRFGSELDIIKFICKEFWVGTFKKQVDNLRTNHLGVYVILDSRFKLLTHMSAGDQYLESAPKYLAYTCGLVRGALASFGINSVVTAEVSSMPSCKFQIMIPKT